MIGLDRVLRLGVPASVLRGEGWEKLKGSRRVFGMVVSVYS